MENIADSVFNRNESIVMFGEDGFESFLKYLGNSNWSNDIIRQRASKNLLKSLNWLAGSAYCCHGNGGKTLRCKAEQKPAQQGRFGWWLAGYSIHPGVYFNTRVKNHGPKKTAWGLRSFSSLTYNNTLCHKMTSLCWLTALCWDWGNDSHYVTGKRNSLWGYLLYWLCQSSVNTGNVPRWVKQYTFSFELNFMHLVPDYFNCFNPLDTQFGLMGTYRVLTVHQALCWLWRTNPKLRPHPWEAHGTVKKTGLQVRRHERQALGFG